MTPGRRADRPPAAARDRRRRPSPTSSGRSGSTSGSRRSSRSRSRSGTASRSGRSSSPGVVTSGLGFALERLTADAAGRVGVREGFLVVALTWLLAAAFASIPYLFEGGEQLSSPLDAYFEGMSGFTTTGASVVTDFDDDQPLARHLAAVHAVARRDGDHRARDRGAPAAPRRRPPADGVRAARPRDRARSASGSARRRASSGSSTSRLTVVQVLMLSSLGWSASTT